MKIEISDEIAKKCQLDEKGALELLAVALYKRNGIHASLAGKIAGLNEFEFRMLLSKWQETVNYGVQDLIDDIKNNDL